MKLVRSWNQFAAVSPGERKLNSTLWSLLAVALIYAAAEHAVFSGQLEKFLPGRSEEILYDLAVTYVGAFVFYLLNIRLPLRRDRRNIYPHVGPMIGMIVRHSEDMIKICNATAGIDPPDRANTWKNIQDMCSKISPASETPKGPQLEVRQLVDNTVAAMITDRLNRVRANIDGIMKFSSVLATDLVDLLVDIEKRSRSIDFQPPLKGGAIVLKLPSGSGETMTAPLDSRWVGNTDLSIWAEHIFKYLTLVQLLDAYSKSYLGLGTDYMKWRERPELTDAFNAPDDKAPLGDYVRRTTKN